MLQALLELVFPRRCVGCGRHGGLFCAGCRAELRILEGVCTRCALPRGIGGCRGCERLSPALQSLRAVCAYEGAARAAVHALKYRGGRLVAQDMGALMCQGLATRPLHADVVVPVPMSARRRRERGYNQALLLAREVARAVGGIVQESLERDDRPAQQGLTAAQRLTNLGGTVRARMRLDGQRVLLVDDVATTGATLSACAEALMAAGSSDVRAYVFARDL